MKKPYLLLLIISTHFTIEINGQNIDTFIQEINTVGTPGASDDKDLEFLIESLENTRIVALGEQRHRYETYSQLKTRIIKYLHQNLDYEIIAFESSLSNSYCTYYSLLSDTAMLEESIYRIWQTESVLDLFNYIKANKTNEKPLIQTGFDLKSNFSKMFSNKLAELLKPISLSYSESIIKTDTFLMKQLFNWEMKQKKISKLEFENYKTIYTNLSDTLDKYKTEIIASNKIDRIQFKIIQRSVLNRIYLSDYLAISKMTERVTFRDKIMADNLNWLVNDLYPNKKIILWAADVHISKNASDKAGKSYIKSGWKSMIELLPDSNKEELYVISFTPLNDSPKELKKELEYGTNSAFIDLRNAKAIKNEKIQNEISELFESFDAIIYFKELESIDKYMIRKK